MAINFPTSLDSFTPRTSGQTISEDHVNDLQLGVEALEEKVGIDGEELIQEGDAVLFYADTAPIGWTLDTSMDDKLVFVTKGSGAGGQTGGGIHSTGAWVISGLSDSGHAHDPGSYVAAVQAHSHPLASGTALETGGYSPTKATTTTSSGNHSATVSGSSANGNASIASSGAWRPAAYSFICCTKDAFPLSS